MSAPKRSPSVRVLFWLADLIYNHRRWFFYPQAVLVVVCLLYTTAKLEFLTNRSALVGGDKEYHRLYQLFRQEFPVQDDLVVVVESEHLEKNRQFVERLAAKLQMETNLFSNVFYKGDLKLMGPKALLFLQEQGLEDLRQTLLEFKPFLLQFTRATNLVSLFDLVNSRFRTARREESPENKAFVRALPALERILVQASDGLVRVGHPPSPGVYSLFDEGQEAEKRMYITYGNGRVFLVTAQARRAALNGPAIGRLRQFIDQAQLEVPGINVGLTGEPVLEVDEMAQSQRDTTLATVVSLVLVALIFIYGYHATGRPLKATVCLLVGLVYTMGFTTLAIGHLNILTITFVPILIGLAIDFGVHLITRYEEELRHGRSEKVALEKAIVNTGMGIFTGAFTTAGAFFAMALTDFDGIQEMGIICGGGLLVCLVPMMTLLPVMLLRGRQNILDHELGEVLDQQAAVEVDKRARLENIWLRRPLLVIVLTVLLTAPAFLAAPKVRFDYNLLNMQSAGLPAVIFQNKLIQSADRSLLFGAIVADSLTQATNLTALLTNLPSVASVDSMSGFLTEDQTRKLARLSDIKKIASEIQFPPADARPADVAALTQTLWSLHGYLGLAQAETEKEDPQIHARLVSLRGTVGLLLARLRNLPRETVAEKLAQYQQALFLDVRETFQAIQNQDDRDRLRAEDLPEALRARFIGVTGKHLLQVSPKKDVWNRAEQAEFIADLRKVDPKATGTPVQLFEYTGLLKRSYQEAALYSLAAIALLIFLHFRKFSCVALALIPVAIGGLWTLGLMVLFHVPFNPANIMTLPLIVGIGVTNGVHILNRFAEEQHPSILARSTGKAVLVSGLTTIAGFGSLILADHRGIKSLGYIMATGVAACMIVGLTLLPAILNALDKHGWTIKRIKRTQRDNARSPLGWEEPR